MRNYANSFFDSLERVEPTARLFTKIIESNPVFRDLITKTPEKEVQGMDAEGLETYADELIRAARGWSDPEDLAQETMLAAGRGRMVCSATNKHYDLLRRKYGLLTAFMKRAAACGDDDPTGANPPMLVIDDANAR